jgi:hypothetical protein
MDKNEYKLPEPEGNEEEKIEIEVEGEEKPEVEVVDDTPPEDRDRKPMTDPPADVTDDELAQYSESVKKRIQHFAKGYHEERRAKEAALREHEAAVQLAQKLYEENKKLQGSQAQSQQVLLEQAKKVVQNEVEDAKRKLKEAYDAGDSDKLLEAQEALTAAKIRADRVNNFKPAPVQEEKPVVQPAPQAVTSPQETKVDPKAAAWQDENSWFGTDEEMTAVALTVHRKLVASGVDPNSDDYYRSINRRMREVFPSAFTSEKPEKRKSSPVVAAATRSTAPRKIVLTQSQVNIAKRLGVPLEAYARQVAEDMRKQNG